MRFIIGATIEKRCLQTLLQQPQRFSKTSRRWTHHQSSTLSLTSSAITYYITAIAAVSTLYRTTTTTSALYSQSKPQRVLLYRPVLVRRIATAATFWNTNILPRSTATTATTKRSMSSTTIRDNGTITITPKKETDQSALIVIAHGLGDSAEGFVDVAEVRHKEKNYFVRLFFG